MLCHIWFYIVCIFRSSKGILSLLCIVKFDFGKMKLDLEHTHIGWGIVRGVQGGCKPFKIPLQEQRQIVAICKASS